MSNKNGRFIFTILFFLAGLVSANDAPQDARFRSIVYFYPGVTEKELSLPDKFTAFQIVDGLPESADKPVMAFQVIESEEISNSYPVPDLKYLSYFGRGLDKGQAQKIQGTDRALIIDVAYPLAMAREGLKSASASLLKVVDPDTSLIWDSATRELFTKEAWKQARVDAWQGFIPLVEEQTVIHAYQGDDGGVRAITLGMEKLGLPDIVVNNFSWSMNDSMGHLINLVGQSMVEGVVPNNEGNLEISIEALEPTPFKHALLLRLRDNAESDIELAIGEGRWEEGDPHNFLIELLFDKEEGESLGEKQDAFISRLFGWEDSISYVQHNQEIEAASNKAKRKLNGLRRDFNRGLSPGEFIQVKAPFKTPDGGTEWMWVEVASWQGNNIVGLLKNEPYHIPSLRGGSTVEVNQQDVFDYLRMFPDGSSEGNETGELILKYQQ